MSVLVTGGAGYIGSHVVAALRSRGETVVVVDDLSTGVAERLGDIPVERIDLADPRSVDRLRAAMARERVDAVIHLAAKKQVGESMQRPVWYYRQNVGGLANLLTAIEYEEIPTLLFSSSAAVYGDVLMRVVDEDAPTVPVNPYGQTKLAGEWMVNAAAAAAGIAATSLRYFNVAGAGEPRLADRGVDNLIPITVDRVLRGQRPVIFGTDYDTEDGTCVRDFVHVADLAAAHVAALDRLRAGGAALAYNIGSGSGYSVRQVVATVTRLLASTVSVEEVPRRAGDPASVIAVTSLAESDLGWRARRDLDDMVRGAIAGFGS